MGRFSAKNKIYTSVFIWLVLVIGAFGYAFPYLNRINKGVAQTIQAKAQDLAFLEAEQQNFKQAKAELDKLAREEYQPDKFFNKDISLVTEVRELEALSERMNVKVTLSNLRGTLMDAQKAKTKGEIFIVPFNLAIQGSLADVVAYIEALENLQFLVHVSNVSFSANDDGSVSASVPCNFYLKK